MTVTEKMQSSADGDHFVCPMCQTENRANAKFCRRCGQPRVKAREMQESREIKEIKEIKETKDTKYTKDTKDIQDSPQKLEPVQTLNRSRTCGHCQAKIRNTDNFCSWCGQENAGKSLVDSMRCPGCHQQLPAQANFCFACGVHVGPHKRLRLRPPGEIFLSEEEEFFPIFDA